ncbi:MAG: hypothetical protein IJT00_08110 [Lachnospiraceae bacterium]|nr:hypothetical protein [Lachnospiraceae bacterium]
MSDDKKANGVYNPEEFDTVSFPMMKGSKDIIKNHCDSTGETYHSFLRRAVVNQIARDREAMSNPEIDPNTKFEGWLHYPDNVKKQIVESFQDWQEQNGKEPFTYESPKA